MRAPIYSLLLGILASSAALRSAAIDRIEIVVDRQVITETQLEQDICVTGFLNNAPLAFSLDQRRAAADRLIDQLLIRQEMALSRYPPAEEEAVDNELERLRQQMSGVQFDENMRRYGISPDVLRQHLALQTTTLQFIAFRFRPELGITGTDLEDSYRRLSATWPADHPNQPLPSLEASRSTIRRALLQQRTEQALDTWLKEARRRVKVVYVDSTLQTAP